MLFHLPQASGPPLPLLALDLLPVAISPSLPLTTARQCSLEEDNNVVESVTAILWILKQWYIQKLSVYDTAHMNLEGGIEIWYTQRDRKLYKHATAYSVGGTEWFK